VARAQWWDSIVQDLRQAVRGLVRSPGLTAAVIVMLGLGIGGAAAMFGLLDRVLLRVGPHVAAPQQLRRLYINYYDDYFSKSRVYRASFSEPQVRAMGEAFGARAAVGSLSLWRDRLDGPGGPRVPVAFASGHAFEVLGTRAAVGRLIEPDDDQPAADPVAVISHGLWVRHFGGRRDIVGQTLRMGAMRYSIVGVAPRGFSGLRPDKVDAWVPLQVGAPAHYGPHWKQSAHIFDVVIRLRAPADEATLAATAQRVYRAASADGPRRDTTAVALFAPVAPYHRPGPMGTTTRLSLIVAGVAAILCLIAVANATNLLLLRAVTRRRETAVRLALGIGRARLVRAVLIESVVLALGGAAAAGLVALWGGNLLQKLVVRSEWQQGVVDARVLLLAGLAGLIIGIVTGLIPGWQASRPDAVAALKAGARSGPAPSRLRSALLGFQAALAITLLAGLALFARSFQQARAEDYVVDTDRLINVDVDRAAGRREGVAELADELEGRLRRLPGVAGVARASIAPIYGYGGAVLRVQGVDSFRMDQRGPFFSEVDTAFLAVTGLPLLNGRGFTAAEVVSSAPVALVNDAFVRRFWPAETALGKCLYVGRSGTPEAALCRQVVGIVSSYRNRLGEAERMQNYYLPLGERWESGSRSLIVRSAGPAPDLVPAVARLVRQRLPEAEPEAVMAINDIVARQLNPWRSGTTLFALFAGLAVLLSMGGLYSVVAFSVAQRTGEFAIRIALGAQARDLASLVLGMALRPVAAGLVVGMAATLWLVRYLAPLLYETGPRDPRALGAAAAALVLTAMAAAVLPARTAARSDPREALQAE
jgi:predicted permease